jgi:hypothetical protein
MKNSFLVLLSLLFSVSYAQQNKQLIIVDAITNTPLNNVNITNVKTLKNYFSDSLGYFKPIEEKGGLIGFVGITGRSIGAHLDYEVNHNGKPDNPNNYF